MVLVSRMAFRAVTDRYQKQDTDHHKKIPRHPQCLSCHPSERENLSLFFGSRELLNGAAVTHVWFIPMKYDAVVIAWTTIPDIKQRITVNR
jgi:hypothetical protein